MKIIYYLFFILFCSVQLSGQMKDEPIAENRALSSERKNFDALFAQLELYFESDSLLSQKEQLITVHDLAIRNNFKDFLSVIDLNLAIILQAEGNYRESISVGKEGAQIARELKDMEGLTKCLNIIAISYLKIPALDSAGIYLDEAFELAETYNYTVLKAPILNNLASLELQVGNKEDAVSIYLQLVDLYEAEHKHSSTAVVYNNLAEVSRSTGNYTLALEYGHKSKMLFDSLSDWQGVIMSSINLAHTYAEVDSLELSRKMFYNALSLSQSVKDSFQIAVIHHGIAKYWMKNERYEKAKAHLDTSMQICLKKGYLVGQMRNYGAFASLSNQKGLYKLAISDLENAKRIADELNLKEEKINIFDLFFKSYEGMGNQTDAIKYLELKYQLKDSLLLDKRNKNVIYLQSKYNRERNQKQIAKLEHTILEKENKIRQYIIAILVVILIFGFVIFGLVIRRKNTKLEKERVILENKLLKVDVDYKNKELARNALFLANAYEQSTSLVKKLDELFALGEEPMKESLIQLQEQVAQSIPAQAWQDFEDRFEQVHAGFFQNLTTRYPGLTPNEVRICSLLRLNLNTKEIAALMNRTTGTIDNARSNIRKKMRLEEEDNLTTLLMSM